MNAFWRGMLNRAALALGLLIVFAMSATYYATREPAYMIAVRWSTAAPPEARAVLRVRHSLRHCKPVATGTEECAILDTGRLNVRQLIDSPLVDDTNYVERGSALFIEPRLGSHWTWAAHQYPLLRRPALIEAIFALGVALVVAGLLPSVRRLLARRAPVTA